MAGLETSAPALRPAHGRDAAAMAELAVQLGYDVEPGEMAERLGALPPSDRVLVAEIDGQVVGWVHLELRHGLVIEPQVEVLGLIVRQGWRGRGVGKALMGAAENFARQRGVRAVRLRSATHRSGAHAFYAALGFEEIKRQSVFMRKLE